MHVQEICPPSFPKVARTPVRVIGGRLRGARVPLAFGEGPVHERAREES
jgi:hypothetical protein